MILHTLWNFIKICIFVTAIVWLLFTLFQTAADFALNLKSKSALIGDKLND